MTISRSELQQLATLSRLQLPQDDLDELSQKLTAILDFFAELNAVDTDAITPMAHPLNMVQRLRADEVTEVSQRDKYQRLAPEVEAGLYLVPRVIE